ncbi:A/G-specific adenine glycosylase [Aliiroseovarius sp. PTFE2010]|uniref:A/G-specific adenine glycosylase n=1 Tax=Aliiroseovarius sp. PTFE2010 TaxID=3417190 RepID=UPI003CEFCCA0
MSDALLAWYDQYARDLPWRVSPQDRAQGVVPDPYRVWLSEVMLQQTTVPAVRDYFHRFTARWPRVTDLAAAEDADVMAQWAGLGYYARARNLLKCARAVVQDHGGRFPDTRDGLIALPGIGPYTAAAISAIAFEQPETVVDGNVERVMARVFAVRDPLPGAKRKLSDLAARLTPQHRAGDYAQAVMDLGATVCTPRSPSCGICPWQAPCAARAKGIAAELPKKTAKKPKPVRRGYVYLAHRGPGWLVETRPGSGLLGGMLGFPGTDWTDDPAHAPPFDADWRNIGGVKHTFTHFHLELTVMAAPAPDHADGRFEPVTASSLPTVMKKAYVLAQTQD